LGKEISKIEQKEVRVTAVIISSMEAVYASSLKDLQQLLQCSDHEIRKIGKHLSETVIKRSLEIWRQDMKNRYKEKEEEQEQEQEEVQEVQEVTEEVWNLEEEQRREHGGIIERREDQDQTEEEGIVEEMESRSKEQEAREE
jgi:hypothetical protein